MPQASPMNWVVITTLISTSMVSFTMLLSTPTPKMSEKKFFPNKMIMWMW